MRSNAPRLRFYACINLIAMILCSVAYGQHDHRLDPGMTQPEPEPGKHAERAHRDHLKHSAQMPATNAIEQQRALVTVDPAWISKLDLRTQAARIEPLAKTIRATATVVPAEGKISHVHTRVDGWIEKLMVRTTGEHVKAGQPLAAIFSQNLYASQVEYLAALERAGNSRSEVVRSARRRLQVLGMSERELDTIEKSGEPRDVITLSSHSDGVVLRLNVSEGTAVDPSTELVTIVDLNEVWVVAEIPEREIPLIASGMTATVEIPASGMPPFDTSVDFLYPTLSERTRSLRVRIVVDNPDMRLRPGMVGTAVLRPTPRTALTVPRDAVVDTGEMQYVFIAAGKSSFEPKAVSVGMRTSDRVEITAGLAEGDKVLTSGVFLIDSESRLRSSGGGGLNHSHGSHGAAGAEHESNHDKHSDHSDHDKNHSVPDDSELLKDNPHRGH